MYGTQREVRSSCWDARKMKKNHFFFCFVCVQSCCAAAHKSCTGPAFTWAFAASFGGRMNTGPKHIFSSPFVEILDCALATSALSPRRLLTAGCLCLDLDPCLSVSLHPTPSSLSVLRPGGPTGPQWAHGTWAPPGQEQLRAKGSQEHPGGNTVGGEGVKRGG